MKLLFCDAKRIFEILVTWILLLWNRQLVDKIINKIKIINNLLKFR